MKLFRFTRTSRLASLAARFHRDERGDEGINKVLILALIVLPLVMVLISFSEELVVWFQESWEAIRGEGATNVRI